jgi:hypothetical protein
MIVVSTTGDKMTDPRDAREVVTLVPTHVYVTSGADTPTPVFADVDLARRYAIMFVGMETRPDGFAVTVHRAMIGDVDPGPIVGTVAYDAARDLRVWTPKE